jgi:hypothetical protein
MLSKIEVQPALVRHDGFSLFTAGDPNNVLSSRFIQRSVWARGVSVQVSALPPAKKATSLIIKKPCHFDEVSYEGLTKK